MRGTVRIVVLGCACSSPAQSFEVSNKEEIEARIERVVNGLLPETGISPCLDLIHTDGYLALRDTPADGDRLRSDVSRSSALRPSHLRSRRRSAAKRGPMSAYRKIRRTNVVGVTANRGEIRSRRPWLWKSSA